MATGHFPDRFYFGRRCNFIIEVETLKTLILLLLLISQIVNKILKPNSKCFRIPSRRFQV